MKISAVILSNGTDINPLVLNSVAFADEIIILSSSPNPSSAKASLIPPIKTLYHPLNNDFSAQRNYALQKARGEWVIFLDSDEYVGTELAREMVTAIENPNYSGYLIKRVDLVFHQPLLHGETGDSRILRLARRTKGKFFRPVHEVWKIEGRVGELSSPLYHLKSHFVSDFISKMSSYGRIDSQILTKEGKPFSWFRLLFFPIAKFKLNYFLKMGFLDGTAGLFHAYLMAVQSLSVRIFQWENLK